MNYQIESLMTLLNGQLITTYQQFVDWATLNCDIDTFDGVEHACTQFSQQSELIGLEIRTFRVEVEAGVYDVTYGSNGAVQTHHAFRVKFNHELLSRYDPVFCILLVYKEHDEERTIIGSMAIDHMNTSEDQMKVEKIQ